MLSNWAIPEILVWIIMRNAGLVDQVSPDITSLYQTRRFLSDHAVDDQDISEQIMTTLDELIGKLSENQIECLGSRISGDVTSVIPLDRWSGLKIIGSSGNRVGGFGGS
jgi:hypothetical protein